MRENHISKVEIVTGFSCNNSCRFCPFQFIIKDKDINQIAKGSELNIVTYS